MRVWIADTRRWGESDEIRWWVTWWGIPPEDEFGEHEIDDAPEHWREFKTERGAMAYAAKAAKRPDNFWKLAQVEKMGLEQVDGDSWGREPIGDMIEVAA